MHNRKPGRPTTGRSIHRFWISDTIVKQLETAARRNKTTSSRTVEAVLKNFLLTQAENK